MTDAGNAAFMLRFQAAVQDRIAELRKRDGEPTADAVAKAHDLRVKANLIEQGVPQQRLALPNLRQK